MRSWDLLTSICKEMLNMQISDTQILKNSSALLLPLLSSLLFPVSELLLLVLTSFLVFSFIHSRLPFSPFSTPPPHALTHLVSFVFPLICPTCLSTFPYHFLAFPAFLNRVWMDKQDMNTPHHGQTRATMRWHYFEKFQSPLDLWVPVKKEAVGMAWRWPCYGLWIHNARIQVPALPVGGVTLSKWQSLYGS